VSDRCVSKFAHLAACVWDERAAEQLELGLVGPSVDVEGQPLLDDDGDQDVALLRRARRLGVRRVGPLQLTGWELTGCEQANQGCRRRREREEAE
jgi:hypothetical protein